MNVRSGFLLVLLIAMIALSCSKQEQSGQTNTPKSAAVDGPTTPDVQLARIPENGSLKDTLEYYINDALIRLRYNDKSGLYENEFRYYTDEISFDAYLQAGQLQKVNADTLDHVTVLNVTKLPGDSVLVGVEVVFEGKNGNYPSLTDSIVMYYADGRWKKPTVSFIVPQRDYEKIVEQAKRDAGR